MTMPELVNEAVEISLDDDAEDLLTYDERKGEPSLSLEEVVKALKDRGRI